MNEVHWTGHPFVDAGLVAIAAVANVGKLEELTPQHLQNAVDELQRILLSDQALGLGGVGRAFSGPKKNLGLVFPNSELDNPSNWQGNKAGDKAIERFREGVYKDLNNALRCLESEKGDEPCWICGDCAREKLYQKCAKTKSHS